MYPVEQVVAIVSIFAVASFLHGYSGFGYGIMATSLLSFLGRDMTSMTALVTVGALTTILALLYLSRSDGHIHWLKGLLLFAGVLVGQPFGYAFTHRFGDQPIFKILLGVVLVAFAANAILSPRMRWRPRWFVAVPAGIVSGFLSGAFVTGGPPIIAFLYSQTDDAREMKGTVQFVFLMLTLSRITLVGVSGDFSGGIVKLALCIVPVMVPLLVAGHALSKRASPERFRQYVYTVILVLGVVVFGRGVWGWLH